ncbi:MAG: hypothetical protein LBT21_00035 [Oscillospiraceae bacterium]|jgi:hypothetical protein|nr:hypothetical protein [Oscillospiraceae bacterium]
MKTLIKLRFLPLITSLAVLACGCYFAVFKAGAPYQDPTPDLQAEWERYMQIGGWLNAIGLLLLLFSVVFLIVLRIKANNRTRHDPRV